MITVGASTQNDTKAGYSNEEKNSVDIFAPGDNILSCYPTQMCVNGTHDVKNTTHYANGYHYMSGTSMAAPLVAGVAALILSEHPNASAATMKQWIMSGVDIVYNSAGKSTFGNLCVSGGRLNAYKAVSNHMYTYFSNNASTHTRSCHSGSSSSESHTWQVVSNRIVCSECGYQSNNTINSQAPTS